jgi:very-short-patch-repair endonuclease
MDKTLRARELRRQPTAAEKLLWAQLRDRRLGGFKFRPQRPIESYFVDFVCVEQRLVVEVDGEPHDLTFAHDSVRDAKLMAAGYRVLRFRNDEVRSNLEGVRQTIMNTLEAEPLPSP